MNLKKLIKVNIILITLFCCAGVSAQENIDCLVNKLTSNSFDFVVYNYLNDEGMVFDENSESILINKDVAVPVLMKNIGKPDKFLAIHLLLTKILQPDELIRINPLIIYDIDSMEEEEVFLKKYIINRMVFVYNTENESYIYSEQGKNKIINYWKELTHYIDQEENE